LFWELGAFAEDEFDQSDAKFIPSETWRTFLKSHLESVGWGWSSEADITGHVSTILRDCKVVQLAQRLCDDCEGGKLLTCGHRGFYFRHEVPKVIVPDEVEKDDDEEEPKTKKHRVEKQERPDKQGRTDIVCVKLPSGTYYDVIEIKRPVQFSSKDDPDVTLDMISIQKTLEQLRGYMRNVALCYDHRMQIGMMSTYNKWRVVAPLCCKNVMEAQSRSEMLSAIESLKQDPPRWETGQFEKLWVDSFGFLWPIFRRCKLQTEERRLY